MNEEKEREEREGRRQENERMRLAPVHQPAPAPSPGPGQSGQQPVARARQDSGSGQGSAGATLQVRQEPLFHSVPPRPQRLLHSEAYIKYIEVSNNLNLKFPKEGRCNTIFPRFEGAHCAH